MNLTTDLLPWDSDDQRNWRAFLQTQTGSRLIPKMLESIPQLLAGGETNTFMVRTGEVRGWAESARTLLSMTAPTPEPPKPADSYPALNDDAAWGDGKKTT